MMHHRMLTRLEDHNVSRRPSRPDHLPGNILDHNLKMWVYDLRVLTVGRVSFVPNRLKGKRTGKLSRRCR